MCNGGFDDIAAVAFVQYPFASTRSLAIHRCHCPLTWCPYTISENGTNVLQRRLKHSAERDRVPKIISPRILEQPSSKLDMHRRLPLGRFRRQLSQSAIRRLAIIA